MITHELAQRLRLADEEVLICSTGVIGEPIPVERVNSHLDHLINSLDKDASLDAANAILTTDLQVKQIAYQAVLGGRRISIGGMAKGSGMIHPSMATMLSYITCDVGVNYSLWSEMIKRVAESSFNAITVDGDTSTNDCFMLACTGAADMPIISSEADQRYEQVKSVFLEQAKILALFQNRHNYP